MGVEYICDGCGKREPADNTARGFFKPYRWLQRGDENGTQVVCSRECRKDLDARRPPGRHRAILRATGMKEATPAAYLWTLTYETGETTQEVTIAKRNPFGKRGVDFDPSYKVKCEPLYRTANNS